MAGKNRVMSRFDLTDQRREVGTWFERHAEAVYAYASRRVGADIAFDVTSETFEVALTQFGSFDQRRGNERAWLFGIASNLLHRHWRSERAHLRRVLLLATIGVESLSPADRDLLTLVAWERCGSRETGRALGLPAGTVRSRLRRIRRQLQRALETQGEPSSILRVPPPAD